MDRLFRELVGDHEEKIFRRPESPAFTVLHPFRGERAHAEGKVLITFGIPQSHGPWVSVASQSESPDMVNAATRGGLEAVTKFAVSSRHQKASLRQRGHGYRGVVTGLDIHRYYLSDCVLMGELMAHSWRRDVPYSHETGGTRDKGMMRYHRVSFTMRSCKPTTKRVRTVTATPNRTLSSLPLSVSTRNLIVQIP